MNKGFTLIELLAVVTLVAAITITIGVNMSDMLYTENQNKIKNYESQVATAGCVYAEVNNILTDTSVTINTLIDEGYLKKDLTNPSTEQTITNEGEKSVIIKMEDNERKCTFTADTE